MKRIFTTAFTIFCFLFLLFSLGISSASAVCDSDEYFDILRLHVIANSDTGEDIALKYKVRDEVLSVVYDELSRCESVQEAIVFAYENKEKIENAANMALIREGSDERATVEIGKKQYPEKEYKGVIYPEGEYLSLRVIIGDGNGKNWWCVLFPSIYDEEYVKEDKASRDTSGENAKKGSFEIFGCRIRFKLSELF